MKWLQLILFILIPMGIGKLSVLISGDLAAEYAALKLPPFSPPSEIFPIAWSIIYLLLGTGAWLVYRQTGSCRNLKSFAAQIIIGFMWSPIFFGSGLYAAGSVCAAFLAVVVWWMMRDFYKIKKIAGLLQIPYFAWCWYAVYLSFGVWQLNG